MASIRDLADAVVRMEGSMLPGSVNMTMVAQHGLWNVGHLVWADQRNAVPVVINGRTWAGWPTYDEAYAGLIRQIRLDTSRGMTLSQFIAKYAPKNENNTAAYIANVSAWTGIPPDARLSDALDDWQNPPLAPALNSRLTPGPVPGGKRSLPAMAAADSRSPDSTEPQRSGSSQPLLASSALSSSPGGIEPGSGSGPDSRMPRASAGSAQDKPEEPGDTLTIPAPSPARSGPILAAQRAALARFLIRLARLISGEGLSSGV
jgi:hypothetical protein